MELEFDRIKNFEYYYPQNNIENIFKKKYSIKYSEKDNKERSLKVSTIKFKFKMNVQKMMNFLGSMKKFRSSLKIKSPSHFSSNKFSEVFTTVTRNSSLKQNKFNPIKLKTFNCIRKFESERFFKN